MKRLVFLSLVAYSIVACGGGLSGVDLSATTDSARLQAEALSLCAPDAPTCVASKVRALERASLCLSDSVLFRHGEPTVDAGVQCQPR